MKKLIIALIVLAVFYSCNSNKSGTDKEVKIKGKISQIDEEKVVIKYQLKSDTIKTDADGNFESTISIDKPCYVLIVNGSNEALTFLNPGISISFEADGSDFVNTLTFKDGNAEINNYLAKQNRLISNELSSDDCFLYSSSYESFLSAYNNFIAQYEQNINDIIEKSASKFESFKTAEAERFKLLKSTILYEFLFTAMYNEIDLPEGYYSGIEKINSEIEVDNPDLIFFAQYMPFVSNLLADNTSVQLIEDSIDNYEMDIYGKYYFAEIDKLFKDKIVRDEVYYYSLIDFISFYGPEGVTEAFKIYKDFSECEDRISNISSMLAEYDKIAPGKPSVEWSFPDINGKNISSSDFIGKYVYIDVWASWCGPCKDEIPFLEALKKKLAGKNIVFISISVDDNIEDWKNSLKKESATGIQLYAEGWDNVLCKHFKINSIPRFILLDREGNIIKSDADRPSGEIETVINDLEGI